MKRDHHRTLAAASLVAVGCAFTASCTSAASPSSKPTATRPVASPSLPAFPAVSQQNVLAEAAQNTGHSIFTTKALSSSSITVRIGCIGAGTAAVSLQVFQGSTAPIYQINKQPCDGSIQKAVFTADHLTPMTVTAQAPPGNRYALLVTQG
ncbi:hypothetical protein GXW83_15500 [Streptacidiphilus sp. PB12-B1b]|uniref:hypothetical protein n=1 Tax=Streptacidiphilus sp. PB12-B1b TaxID=2705012 RepID=UPI0015F8DF62|nr:hypothetical protein [Streptacidiphilus sp. PB12-B1b]QMU76919.1 hypothetical protein GXW83_15500 [Streptacidiphilus sp. PB12-B1b]